MRALGILWVVWLTAALAACGGNDFRADTSLGTEAGRGLEGGISGGRSVGDGAGASAFSPGGQAQGGRYAGGTNTGGALASGGHGGPGGSRVDAGGPAGGDGSSQGGRGSDDSGAAGGSSPLGGASAGGSAAGGAPSGGSSAGGSATGGSAECPLIGELSKMPSANDWPRQPAGAVCFRVGGTVLNPERTAVQNIRCGTRSITLNGIALQGCGGPTGCLMPSVYARGTCGADPTIAPACGWPEGPWTVELGEQSDGAPGECWFILQGS